MSVTVSETTHETAAGSGIEQKLVRAWRRARRFVDLRGVAHLFLWFAALVALDFFLDWMWILSSEARWALLAANALVLTAVVYFRWLRHVRRYDPVRTALEVEACHPQLKSLLVSFVQLRRRTDVGSHVSPRLVQAMCDQAAVATDPLDFNRIVNFRGLRWLGLACAVVLVLVGLAVWRGGSLVDVFVQRMSNPFSRQRYPTNTRLTPVTEDAVVQEGRPFVPTALAEGEIPKEATLVIRPIDGDIETVTLSAGKETGGRRAFAYNLGEVYRSFTYSFHIGDAVSETYTVTVVPPPQVKFAVTVATPKYTRRKAATSSSLSAEALEGSQISWECSSDRPLATAELVLDGEKSSPLELDATGRVARGTIGNTTEGVTKSFTYSFRWKDREHGFAYAPAAQYTIQVTSDRPPRATLVAPSRDVGGTTQKVVDLRVSATDDYGLSSARLVYSVTNSTATGKGSIPETIVPIKTDALQQEPLQATLSLKLPLSKTIPDLAPGDTVHLAVEVSDNRPGTPAVTRSETRRITILTPAEYLAYIQKQRDRLLTQIRELQAVEKNAAETLDEELKSLTDGLENAKP